MALQPPVFAIVGTAATRIQTTALAYLSYLQPNPPITVTPNFFALPWFGNRAFSTLLLLMVAVLLTPYPVTAHASPKAKHSKQKSASKSVKAPPERFYADSPQAMQLADAIAARSQLDATWVRQTIGQARFLPGVAKAVLPPPNISAKNWTAYRARFIDDKRIQAGVKFWQSNQATLERAERETGVPIPIIVGIVGIETIYGQYTGKFRTLDALSTLAFDFPEAHPKAKQRTAFFKSELEAFLNLTQRTKIDPLKVRGSYAGALGLPQFMPSSWNKYAVDFDSDGHIDLFNSQADVIGSVANYFKTFRWRPGMPTHYPVQVDAESTDMATLLAPDILPSFTPEQFTAKGAVLQGDALKHQGLLALVELKNGDAEPNYIAGTENFYVITRYNWSSYYAMSVIELGQEVAKAWTAQTIMAK
jgi:membrane-bound lytic murein transglycosylase B